MGLAFRVVAYLGQTAIPVAAIDVSIGGIAVTSDRRLEPDSSVRMSFSLADGRLIEVDAVVVRVQRRSSTTWLWGLAFRGLEPRIAARLQRWLDDAHKADDVMPPALGERAQATRTPPAPPPPTLAPLSGRGPLGRSLSRVELAELYRAASDQLHEARADPSTDQHLPLGTRGRR